MISEELDTRYRQFCKSFASCTDCKYNNEEHCKMVWAFDEGYKYTFNAAVDLLSVYKEVYRNANNKR